MSAPLSRREFIQNGLAFVSLGLAMPTLLMQAAKATAETSGLSHERILVVIEMTGGNDGLNTVIPYADAAYAKARPNIGVHTSDVIKISDQLGLHPRMKALGSFYEQGHLAVLNGVGYPNPNRSHFYSMDIWQTGDPDNSVGERTGWLARYFDADGHFQGNPLAGVALGSALPLALYAENAPASVIGDSQGTNFVDYHRKEFDTLHSLYSEGTIAGSNLEFVRNVGMDAYSSTLALKQAIQAYDVKAGQAAQYPPNNGFASSLQTVAKLIAGGLPTRVYYLNLNGFDTHANQPSQHANLLGILSESLAAFYKDLRLQGRDGDVAVVTFSEFGRRVKENSSVGTDHGAASVLFVAGPGIQGGVHGAYPSLTDLDDGDLRHHTDFRSVYATLLDQWLGANSAAVLGGAFPHVGFV